MNLSKDNIVQTMLKAFPEVVPVYNKELEWWDEVLPHVVFGDVLYPFLEEKILGNEIEVLDRLSVFFEDMAVRGDFYVQNLLTTTVLERVGDNPDLRQKVKTLFGERTRWLAEEVERYIGREK